MSQGCPKQVRVLSRALVLSRRGNGTPNVHRSYQANKRRIGCSLSQFGENGLIGNNHAAPLVWTDIVMLGKNVIHAGRVANHLLRKCRRYLTYQVCVIGEATGSHEREECLFEDVKPRHGFVV